MDKKWECATHSLWFRFADNVVLNRLAITTDDTGTGIAPIYAGLICSAFHRQMVVIGPKFGVDTGSRREQQGAG